MKITTPGKGIWIALLILLTWCHQSFSQTLKKLEYAFDTDPGIGNGISMNLPATQILDNTIAFDANGLSNGIHHIFYRIQDINNRWSLTQTISFLKLGGTGNGAPLLKKLEYAFDTDPGINNGTGVALSPVQLLDSTFTIDLSAISNGIHVLYFRVQDIDNKWSQTQRTSIIKFPGNNNGSNIVKAEYFLDTDPGIGNGTALPVKTGNNITDTFTFVVPDLGSPKRMLYVRVQDNAGAWSLNYAQLVDVDACLKTKPDFTFVRYGDRYAFVDSSKNNTEKKYLWRFGNLATDTVSNPTFDFPRGNHNIKLITGTGCRIDSIEKTLYVTLESYYPNKAMRGGDIVMNFFGGSLDTSVVVELRKGSTILRPYKKLSKEFKQFIGFFDLHTAEAGNYDVRLRYKDGFDTTIVNGMAVSGTFVEPDIDVVLTGPATLRRNNEWTYYTLTVSNNGDVMRKGVPYWVTIPNLAVQFEYAIDSKIYSPPGFNGYPLTDSLPEYVPLDSLNGRPYVGRMYLMLAPYINAHSNITFKFRMRSGALGAPLPLQYGCSESLWGSPMKYIWCDGFDDAMMLSLNALGIINTVNTLGLSDVALAAVDAVSAIGDVIIDNSLDIFNGDFSGWSFMRSMGNAVLSATGLKLAKQGISVTKALAKVATGTGVTSNAVSGYDNIIVNQTPCPAQDRLDKAKKKANDIILSIRNSFDPNQVTGPIGFGDQHYIDGKGKAGYIIEFENLPGAGAAAQKVVITDTLDKTKYNLQTFELGFFRIADSVYIVPHQRTQYTTTVDLRPRLNLMVRFDATLDTAKGILRYSFISLDPVTKEVINPDASSGFLPPNNAHPAGSGSVGFFVELKTTLVHKDIIRNKASIVFDKAAPIQTNTWENTLDKVVPVMKTPVVTFRGENIVIHFNTTDDGSGLRMHNIYSSMNSRKQAYMADAYGDSLVAIGHYDSTYRFSIVPTDNVSNYGDSTIVSVKVPRDGTTSNNNDQIQVFPNPNKGAFTMTFIISQQQQVTANLYTVTGQLIGNLFNGNVNGAFRLNPNLGNLKNGLYIIKVKGDKGLQLQTKIIIQH